MMHSHTASQALHIFSISLGEDHLSSKLLTWFASIGVFVAAIRLLLGYILPNNRKSRLLVLWVAELVASSGLLGLARSMQIHNDENYQKAFLGLLLGTFGMVMICEINLFIELQLATKVGIGVAVYVPMMVVGLCVSLVLGVKPSLILKILLLSTFGLYLLSCIGFTYLFFTFRRHNNRLSDLDPANLRDSDTASINNSNQLPWYHEFPWSLQWPLLLHAFLQLLTSALALCFFIMSCIDDKNLVFLTCILSNISNISCLRTLLRQSFQALHTRFPSNCARFHQLLYQYVARFCRLLQRNATPGGHYDPFPKAVFRLDEYKLVYMNLPEVESHEQILCAIRVSDTSWAMIVSKSFISELEQKFNGKCFPYYIEPSKMIEFSEMAVSAISRDDKSDKGLWTCADPSFVVNLFTIWLKDMFLQPKVAPNFSKPSDIDISTRVEHFPLDGTLDVNSYILVRVSSFGNNIEIPDKFGRLSNIVEILSLEELPDASWEIPVFKSCLSNFSKEVAKMFPGCKIEVGYDPTQPNEREVKEFGYETAKALKTYKLHGRAEHMRNEA